MTTFTSIADFRSALRAKQPPPAGGVFRVSTLPSVAVDGAARTRRFCFSDGSVDRMGDTIDPNGWDLANFLANPVALWAHDSWSPPIGRASNLAVEAARLMGDIEFATAEVYPFADTIFRLFEAGFLNAVSVGFLPIEYSYIENDPKRGWGIDFKRQELLEISPCPIPANPNALAEARAKGIDTRPLIAWAEKLLDGGGQVLIPKAQLLALRRQAKESRTMPKPRLRADDPTMTEDPAAGGATVGNCGRPADKECGLKDPAECAIHGFGGAGAGTEDDNADKRLAGLVSAAVRSEFRRLRRSGPGRRRRRDATDGDPGPDATLPEGHEEAIRGAAMHFRSAEDYYDSGDEHHDTAMDLIDQAVRDLDADGGPPDDHDATVRSAMASFRKAEALYDLGDEHHDKGLDVLDGAVKALDGDTDPAPAAPSPEDQEKIAAALQRVAAGRKAF